MRWSCWNEKVFSHPGCKQRAEGRATQTKLDGSMGRQGSRVDIQPALIDFLANSRSKQLLQSSNARAIQHLNMASVRGIDSCPGKLPVFGIADCSRRPRLDMNIFEIEIN